jgi:ribonuclease R
VEDFRYSMGEMVALGEHCSMTERRADEASRDAVDWLKCEYMIDRVGQEFDGIITGVTGFGIFVELKAIYVEGLVHVTGLGEDYFHFEPAAHRLIGDRTRKMFRLADPVRVRVARVDLEDKKIDFDLVKGPR